MATSPLTATFGLHSVSDLLFSPRVAFIWNHTRKSVVWMNPAARAAFALRLEDFSASLPSSLIRRFTHCVETQMAALAKVKIPRGRTLGCTVEILKLAAGEDGLIVAELNAEERRLPAFHAPPPPPPGKAAKSQKTALRKTPLRSAKAARKPAGVPPLSDDEMRAFRAVGRKVLRLCKEKKQGAAQPPAAPPPPARPQDSPAPGYAALKDVLSAFDLVLFLSDGLEVVKAEGRAARFGWRKARLIGKPAAGLLASQDQAAFSRMIEKLDSPSTRRSRKALTLRAGAGNGISCRLAAGRWRQESAAFFLAFVALEPPPEAKGLPIGPFPSASRSLD